MDYDWRLVTALLCLYGFLKELRPSEPFLTEYLIDEKGPNVTLSEAYQEVYPVWTYSYLAVLVPVFLTTDLLRYKPVVVAEGFAYVLTWVLLLWTAGVPAMQAMQVSYGVATATEVAYFTYIYAKVEPRYFQKVTSFTRVSLLLGRFLAGVLGQSLNSAGVLDYRQLNYFTLASVSAATLVSFLLPSVDRTRYFHSGQEQHPTVVGEEDAAMLSKGGDEIDTERISCLRVMAEIKKDFLSAYRSAYVAKWSLWWALGMCGNFQVGNYIQPLWETIAPVGQAGEGSIYNGAVEALTTLTGAALSFALGFLRLNWALLGEPVLAALSAAAGAVLIAMASASDLWHAYAGYVVFRALYQALITVASFEVARNVADTSYGLVFGVNTFAALVFQTLLTLAVADGSAGLSLQPRGQFVAYGVFWLAIGALFLVIFCASVVFGQGGLKGYISQAWDQGCWVSNDENYLDSERREAPLGAIDPQ